MTAHSSAEKRGKEIVVLGAGVIGLSTAIVIQEKPGNEYRVSILAEHYPTDPKGIRYTSHWAGAIHHVNLGNASTRLQEIDYETFKAMWDLSAPGGKANGCFLRIQQTELYTDEVVLPDLFKHMPKFRELDLSELPPGVKRGVTHETVTIDVPAYLNYLLSRFLSSGGRIVHGYAQHLSQVLEGGADAFLPSPPSSTFITDIRPKGPDAVIVCTGLGSRTLGGVEDKDVYPVRGQTVILDAPWVRFGKMLSGGKDWGYVIPRRSGHVVVGGTEGPNDWYPLPRPETTRDILERGLKLCPELAPPEIRALREPTVDDLTPLVVELGCGLRPKRTGGLRLEAEKRTTLGGKEIPVIYNYGHGGTGYISSIGSANIVLQLLDEMLDG
ncbi:D-amino-acid oxidase [Cyathus striatus]|nr:D-amino-acid oxidase [Cyathus striatus]